LVLADIQAVDSIRVALRVFGETLDPDEVAALLGAHPTSACRKGELNGLNQKAATGSWVLESDLSESAELEEQIESILSKLSGDPDEWSSLTNRFAAEIHCRVKLGSTEEGFDLSPRLAEALAERGLAINVQIKAPLAH